MDASRPSLVAGTVVLAAVLGALTVSPALGADAGSARTGDAPTAIEDRDPGQSVSTVVVTQEFAALPERPGTVRATRRIEVPDSVESLRTTLPEDSTVTGTSGGFTRIGADRYEWAGGDRQPSISYTLGVNETGEVAGPEGTDGRFLFVDVGEWGLFRRPQAPVEATYRGSIAFERETAVDGPGAAGEWLIYVGAATETRRRAHGQTFRLVEPAAADLVESREEIFASVTDASDALRVGSRDGEVLLVAAPTSVDWAVEGLQTGDSDVYVTADERVDDPYNVWTHEYVHTRQDFSATRETRWFGEATATYYAALLTLERERIGFEEFRRVVGEGTDDRYGSVVLSDPTTWVRGANYRKGALVAGEVDRRLREATDSGSDLQAVFRRLNERRGDLESADLVSVVDDVGTAEVASAAERYTTAAATPDPWDAATHQTAFGPLPPRIRVALPEDVAGASYRVSGPYRTRTLADPPLVLVPGETLSVDVRLSNVGGREGNYDLTYGFAEGPLESLAGSIPPGEAVTETVDVPVEDVGSGPIRVGEYDVPVSVLEPASPGIEALRANRSRIGPGGAVGLEVDVANPADRPGSRELTVTANGETVATESVRLDAGADRTVALTVRLEDPGTHGIAVGNGSVTVDVERAGPLGGEGIEPTVLAALVALLAVVIATVLAYVVRSR